MRHVLGRIASLLKLQLLSKHVRQRKKIWGTPVNTEVNAALLKTFTEQVLVQET
jgi:hypothetical protein